MMLENFIEKVNGQIISSDNVPANAGQSIQLIAEWCKYIGLPFQWTSPAFWWDEFDSTFLEYWTKVPLTKTQTVPRPGDIVIFGSDLPGSGTHGHGSIFLRTTSDTSWEGLDAYWGGKSAHTQSHSWAYVVGWFTPKNPSVLEAPTPTPIADEAPYAAYEVEPISPTSVTALTQPATLYNLNDVSYDSLVQNPISHIPAGFEITAVAIARHILGGTYYMTDSEKAEGYLTKDFDGPETNEPEEVPDPLRTAGIQEAFNAPLFPPLSAPNVSDTIVVPKRIPYYNSMSNALNSTNACGELAPTTYYIYKRVPSGMLSVTSHPGQSMRAWINPADLREPEPFSWDKTYSLYEHPLQYIATAEEKIFDRDNKLKQLVIRKGQIISIDGETTGPDKKRYGIPSVTRQAGQNYVISMDVLEEKTQPAEKPVVTMTPSIITPASPIVSRQPIRNAMPFTEKEFLPKLPLSAKLYLYITDKFKKK